MIPKIVHYCWLGPDAFPELVQRCIASWRRLLPDYEFMLWDTRRFDLDQSLWCRQAFDAGKYAFAADYIRMYAVYHYGGIYLDCDVEVLKSFDDLLHLPYFVGHESVGNRMEIAAFGAEKGSEWIGEILDYYAGRPFIKKDGTKDMQVMPDIVYGIISRKRDIVSISDISEFRDDSGRFNVFPSDWFCANVYLKPEDGKPTYIVSENTYCVHHFANAWLKHHRRLHGLRKFLHRLFKR